MKKLNKILITLFSLLTISGATIGSIANNFSDAVMVSAEEIPNEETNLGEMILPTNEQMKIMVESGEYYNIHYVLIQSYLNMDISGLLNIPRNTFGTFRNIVTSGMRDISYGQKNPEFNDPVIAELITSSVEIGRGGLYQIISMFGGLTTLPGNVEQTLIAMYVYDYLPSFMRYLNKAIDKMKKEAMCPIVIRDFEPYEVQFSYVEEVKVPTQVPYYWIIVAGVGGITVTALVFILIISKKKKVIN